jgi:hypothetical protein
MQTTGHHVLRTLAVAASAVLLVTASAMTPAASASPEPTPEPAPGPWFDVEPPPMPALVPEAGYEALGSVDTFCVDLGFDPATTGVLQEPHFSSALAFLGFEVVESGCDARLEVTLVADWPASPARYSGDLTCYLDDRSATATATLVVGDEVMGRWESEGNAGAPFTIFSGGCPGPDDPVDVSFMDDPVNESWLGPAFGKVGRAAVAEAGYDLPRFTGLLVGEDGHTVDEQVMAIWVNYLQDENLRGRVMEIHDAFDELAADGQSPPAGMEVLVPLLLRTITGPDMYWEDSLAEAWEVIAWITGIEDQDPDAVWTWYEAKTGAADA